MVKHISKVIVLILLQAVMAACGGGGAETSSSNSTPATDTSASTAPAQPAQKECTVAGKILEGNQLWLVSEQLMLCIKADSSTFDADFGDSHRILEVYDTRDCSQVGREVLPINQSPDFPYFLAEITYNHSSKVVAIRGFSTIYLYDLESRKLSAAFSPKYASERFGEDAQSGMILRLELWEDYLIGYSQDNGSFAFDLSDKKKPRPLLPFAEYKTADESFNSLFLLSSHLGGTQAIAPSFDADSNKFSINPMLPQPQALKTEVVRSAKNNRYVVIRQADTNAAIAIDLQNFKRVELPDDVALKSTQEVLKWVRS